MPVGGVGGRIRRFKWDQTALGVKTEGFKRCCQPLFGNRRMAIWWG